MFTISWIILYYLHNFTVNYLVENFFEIVDVGTYFKTWTSSFFFIKMFLLRIIAQKKYKKYKLDVI